MGQLVDALNTNFINVLAFGGQCGTTCEEDDTILLDNLHSLLRGPDASPSDPSICHRRETPDNVHATRNVAKQVRQTAGAAVCAGDMKIFSVVYVTGFIA